MARITQTDNPSVHSLKISHVAKDKRVRITGPGWKPEFSTDAKYVPTLGHNNSMPGSIAKI